MFPCSSRMGLRLAENCPEGAVAAQNLQFQIVDLLAVERALDGVGQRPNETGRGQFEQTAGPEDLVARSPASPQRRLA